MMTLIWGLSDIFSRGKCERQCEEARVWSPSFFVLVEALELDPLHALRSNSALILLSGKCFGLINAGPSVADNSQKETILVIMRKIALV